MFQRNYTKDIIPWHYILQKPIRIEALRGLFSLRLFIIPVNPSYKKVKRRNTPMECPALYDAVP